VKNWSPFICVKRNLSKRLRRVRSDKWINGLLSWPREAFSQ
jgi:hypothetical protein